MSGMDLSGIDLTTEVVRTERLVLRPFTTDDVDAVLAGCQDPDVQRWIRLGAPRVYLVADVLNTGSQHVARKAGFSQEGVLRSYLAYRDGSRGDAALFSRLPGD